MIVAHLVSVAALLAVLLLGGDVTRLAPMGSGTTPVSTILWGGIALDGAITILFLVFYLGARREALANAVPASLPTPPLLAAERTLRTGLIILGGVLTLEAVGDVRRRPDAVRTALVHRASVRHQLDGPRRDPGADLFVRRAGPAPQPGGRRRARGVVPALGRGRADPPDSVSGDARGSGHADRPARRLGLQPRGRRVAAAGLPGGVEGARSGATFFRPIEYRTLTALADVLLRGEDEQVPAERVAANVERYVRAIRARRPLGLSGDPLRHLSASAALPARPRFPNSTTRGGSRILKTHFYKNVILKVVPDWWRRLVQSMIRIGKQLELHRVLQRSRLIRVGGLRPLLGAPAGQGGTAAWPAAAGCDAAGPGRRRHASTPTSASSAAAPPASDPRLRARRGGAGSVLVLERGAVQPSRALFGEDEVEHDRAAVRRRRVAADRGLALHDAAGQLRRRARPTVNNAVCFRPASSGWWTTGTMPTARAPDSTLPASPQAVADYPCASSTSSGRTKPH